LNPNKCRGITVIVTLILETKADDSGSYKNIEIKKGAVPTFGTVPSY
jgi:hypothetical protein